MWVMNALTVPITNDCRWKNQMCQSEICTTTKEKKNNIHFWLPKNWQTEIHTYIRYRHCDCCRRFPFIMTNCQIHIQDRMWLNSTYDFIRKAEHSYASREKGKAKEIEWTKNISTMCTGQIFIHTIHNRIVCKLHAIHI